MNKQINGSDHEIEFWKGFVKTERFLNGWVPAIKTPELNETVADFIKEHIPMHGSILDSGSGVVSILNGLLPGNFKLLAADLLGEEYEKIFDYPAHGLIAPLAVGAEDLPFDNLFDIVHMSNALDHTQDPKKAYERLWAACKPGGYLIIQGFENEANHENWKGMHQWNIHLDQKTNILVIDGKDGHYVGLVNPVHASLTIFENNKSWFIWIAQKPML